MLKLKAMLAEVVDLCFHPWLVEAVPQFGEGVAGSQVAPERMQMGRIHDNIGLGPGDYQKVAQLPLAFSVTVQLAPLDEKICQG